MKEEKNSKQQNSILHGVRKKVLVQAGIAVSTVGLMLVLIFAMSAAWYTNVVKSGDLIFQTAVWGFQGEVTLGTGAIEAGPGKSGVVSMEVNNNGTDMIFAGVHIAKSMDEDLSKRIYLYVDAATTKNEETMERVYLNSTESYIYLVPSQNKLILQEKFYNDARIMWAWVYDVVGYYFLGTVNQGVVTEDEYLRPIEYDLDAATFDHKGKLLTVDGTTTVASFLTELSGKDGYEGTIDVGQSVNGYYPVSVDENGKGIWVYLCDWAEIQQETQTDVALGSAEPKKTGVVRLNISAQGGQFDITKVSTVSELQSALNNPASGVVQLNADLQLAEAASIVMDGNKEAVLNLNGHTIMTADGTPAFQVTNGGKLTVFDGAIQGCCAGSSTAIKVVNGELTMSRMTINNMVDAVTVADSAGNGQDSMVRISECNLSGMDCALFIKGNGSQSGQYTQITIEKSQLHGDLGAIWGSGNSENWGTAIQIMNSTLTGTYTTIYHPQGNGELTISNSTLESATCIAIKGGNVYITNSVLKATGEGDLDNPMPNMNTNGFTDTGAAIYLETNYACSMSVTVDGEDTLVTSLNDWAIRVNRPDASNAMVQVMGGTFNSSVADFVADGYECKDMQNGSWVVTKSSVAP